jgi:glycosyltransferase involved in cell wall biosynthesis
MRSDSVARPPEPQLSLVVPVYYNEGSLPTTVPALAAVAREIAGESFELVFIDDGSRDRSVELLTQFQSEPRHRLRIVKLTRNFGSMNAIMAGLATARGRAVGIIAADLQDPPELFHEMHAHWLAGMKCVYAVRTDRDESAYQKFTASLFYALLRRFALPGYPSGGFDFCLIDRQVVDDLVRIKEKNTHVMNLVFWLGYPAVRLPYVRRARQHGKSRWTLAKKIKLFVDSFVAFSFAPIRLVSITGFALFLAAIIYGAFLAYMRISQGTPTPGFTTVAALIALTSGIQMMMLGILGEYLWRALDAARSRPSYVVEQTIEPPHA